MSSTFSLNDDDLISRIETTAALPAVSNYSNYDLEVASNISCGVSNNSQFQANPAKTWDTQVS